MPPLGVVGSLGALIPIPLSRYRRLQKQGNIQVSKYSKRSERKGLGLRVTTACRRLRASSDTVTNGTSFSYKNKGCIVNGA